MSRVNPKLRLVVLACAALGFLGLLLVGGLAALAFLGKEVEGIEVALDAPSSVRRGEAFPIRARVRNTASRRQTLVDLDVGSGYLRGIDLHAAEPAWSETTDLLGTGTSYTFNLEIEPGAELVLELQAEGRQAGEFEGDFDFCINSSIVFVTQPLRTVVRE